MKNYKNFIALIIIPIITLMSCEKEDLSQVNKLEQIGVLGQWKLESRVVNGISDLAVQCCDYIEFNSDGNSDGLKGKFKAFGTGYETNGEFELKNSNKTLQFDYDNTQKLYGFQISDEVITFTYSEDNHEVIENWRKEE